MFLLLLSTTNFFRKTINSQAAQTRLLETHDLKVFEESGLDTFVSKSATIENKLTSKNVKQKKKGMKT